MTYLTRAKISPEIREANWILLTIYKTWSFLTDKETMVENIVKIDAWHVKVLPTFPRNSLYPSENDTSLAVSGTGMCKCYLPKMEHQNPCYY